MPIFDPTHTANDTWVVCLCANWCGLCTDYRAVFSTVARPSAAALPHHRFAWIDIEDQADWIGDIDVETFPTLLVANPQGLLFMGALTPHAATLSRLLASTREAGASRQAHTALSQMLVTELPARPEFWLPSTL